MITTATPILADRASSRITPISMMYRVKKPIASLTSATEPGTTSAAKVPSAASRGPASPVSRLRKLLTICTPWLTAIANTKNGTNIEYGSMVKPNIVTMPNCHTTAIKEQVTTVSALRTERVSISSSTAVSSKMTKKNIATSSTAAITDRKSTRLN